MFFEFFGLERNPFRSRISGSEVFVGPQQVTLIASLKKALGGGDAVVSVAGPVGVGKTTIVNRSLSEISASARIARFGRIRLGREDVPELLLAELGAERQPTSAVQQFAELKKLLNQCADDDVRVFIVVEDANRLGTDVLAEIESLTSADGGDSPGAHVILMGGPELPTLLRDPFLARLRQRVLLRQSVEPLSPAEVRGYLANCLRQAGGEIDHIFAQDAVDAVCECSGGIPRVIDNLARAAMTNAAESEADKVSADIVRTVARDEFGLDGETDVATESRAAPAEPEAAPITADEDDFDVPELIQDTQPEMEALKLPDEPAEGIRPQDLAPLRDKTDDTQPSLPVLKLDDPTELADEDAAALAADQQRMILEPREPEPLTAGDPVDSQTIKALDSALRPDTQLLEALEEPPPEIEDAGEVPLGLQGQASSPVSGSQTLPTLSESMRLDAPPKPAPIPGGDADRGRSPADEQRRPNIDKLEAALAIARKGPIDLSSEPAAPAMPAAAQPSAATAANDLPDLSMIPEITLDAKIDRAKEAAQARLAEEAEKLERQQAEKEAAKKAAREAAKPKPHPAEIDFGSIADQLDTDDKLTAPPSARTDGTGAYAALEVAEDEPEEKPAEREKLEKLAEDLGKASSLEDIDDMAAETLFGEEFSEIAAQVAAMAANDMDSTDTEGELVANGEAPAESAPAAVVAPAALQAPAAPQASAAPQTQAAPTAPHAQAAPTAPHAPAAPPQAPQARPAAAPKPPAGSPPPVPPAQPALNSTAALRLEMVRKLNQSKAPAAAPAAPPDDKPEEIVLGKKDNSPTFSGPQPEPIENQFGTSMTATLKALSETSMNAIPKDEIVEHEEKKGGLLSRFKRS